MKVTHITNSVSLLAGGLYTSVRELALAQRPLNPDTQVVAYWDARTEQDREPWQTLAPVACKTPSIAGVHLGDPIFRELERQQPDLTHCHGIWLRSSADNHRWTKKRQRPYLIAPRGMLDPWAVNNSGWKKKIAGYWFEYGHLRDCPCLHALCEEEVVAMRDFGLKSPIAVIPNGIHLPPPPQAPVQAPWASDTRLDGKNVLIFIGRIHPKKGLPLLIDALAQVRQSRPQVLENWSVVVAGYDQGGHLQELQTQARQLNLADHVHFIGPVNGAVKDAALRSSQAFILPSYSEGLPMSVLEAWAYRLPAIATPQCNLPEGFQAGAAIRATTDVAGVASALQQLFDMSPAERANMGEAAEQLVRRRFTWPSIGEQTCAVYQWMLGGGAQPACIA